MEESINSVFKIKTWIFIFSLSLSLMLTTISIYRGQIVEAIISTVLGTAACVFFFLALRSKIVEDNTKEDNSNQESTNFNENN